MKTTFTTENKKGFTLIELLVVIAILATLAGISTPVIMSMQEEGKITTARTTCMQIVEATTRFQNDYDKMLPYRTDMAKADEANNYRVSLVLADDKDAGMLAILTNREETDEPMNQGREYYLKSDEQDKKMNGLYVDPNSGTLGLYDPWGKPYYVLLCDEPAGCIDPFTGKLIRGKQCLVYSLGPNQAGVAPESKPARKSGKKGGKKNKKAEASVEEEEYEEAIADNVYSWKKVN